MLVAGGGIIKKDIISYWRNNMQKLIEYTDFILAIGVILMWVTICLILFVFWIGNKVAYHKFFKAAKYSLKGNNIDDIRRSIINDFEVYRNHRFGFKSKSIIELCQELENKLKLEEDLTNTRSIDNLEHVILILKDDYKIDDEKMEQVIWNLQAKSGLDEARKLREYLIRTDAYYKGILFEKDRCFKDMKEKLQMKKWASILGYVIGIIGSVASIYSIF